MQFFILISVMLQFFCCSISFAFSNPEEYEEEKDFFSTCPSDVVLEISSHLEDEKDVVNLLSTNYFFKGHEDEVWKAFIKRKFERDSINYNIFNDFFPYTPLLTPLEIAKVHHCVGRIQQQTYTPIVFRSPSIGTGLEVAVRNAASGYIGFIFRPTPTLFEDIISCFNLMKTRISGDIGDNPDIFFNRLQGNESLIGLNLRQQNMGAGIERLCYALANNHLPNLESLNFFSNGLVNIHALKLAAAISANDKLRALNLRKNLISDIGAGSLIMALGFNTSLIELDLSNNYIGANGERLIAKVWQSKNRDRDKLNLADNQGVDGRSQFSLSYPPE